jgi:hypothetical protein
VKLARFTLYQFLSSRRKNLHIRIGKEHAMLEPGITCTRSIIEQRQSQLRDEARMHASSRPAGPGQATLRARVLAAMSGIYRLARLHMRHQPA